MSQRVPFYIALSGIACNIIGGISFFFFSSNVTLIGALSLTTYLRVCKEIAICLGKYDYKFILVILSVSLIITLIGIEDYGQSKYWCYTNPSNRITPLITTSLIFLILLVILYCYIMTIMEVYVNIKKFGSKLSQVDIIVARKIILYILIFLLEWSPV
ncbi:21494_t:CDS:2, partial [Dentiscutata erythropus]